jgi:autotransporter-associated beta strand protein
MNKMPSRCESTITHRSASSEASRSFLDPQFTRSLRRLPGRTLRFAPEAVARGLASILALFALFGFNSQILAATDTWTGADTGGAPTTDWANTDNWTYSSGAGPVASGDSLVFSSTNGQATNILTDSLTNSSFAVAGITFNAGSPAYTFTGNAFELTGGIQNNSNSIETIDNAIALGGTQTLGMTGDDNVTLAGPISDGSLGYGLTTSGAGTLTLSGSNSYTGTTTVAAGTTLALVANSANTAAGVTSALSNSSAQLALSPGSTVELLGNTTNTIFETAAASATASGAGIQETAGGTYNFFVGNNGGTASPTTLILGNMGILGEAGNTSYTYNNAGVSGYTMQIGSGAAGNGALYFQNSQTFNVTNPGVTLSVPGGFALNYPANNYYNLSFNGQGNYTVGSVVGLSGDTVNVNFNTSGTSVLNTASTGFGPTAINSGTVKLDFTAGTAPTTNIINSTATLSLGGGTLQVLGATTAGTSQTFTSVTANPGTDVISVAPASGTNLPTLAMGTFAQSVGSQTVFNGPAYYNGATSSGVTTPTANVSTTGNITTTTVGLQNKLLWPAGRTAIATVGLYNWASVNTAAGTNNVLSGDQVTGFYAQVAAGGSVTNNDTNYDLLGSATLVKVGGSGTFKAASYLDTVRFNVAGAFTLTTAAGGTNADSQVGGILVTPNVGANNTTIANGGAYLSPANGGGASAMDLYQNDTAGEFLINAPFQNAWNGSNFNNAGSYVQGGAGTVVLTGEAGNSTNTGSDYLNGGNTVINNDAQLGKAATAAALELNGGTVVASASTTLDAGSGANKRPITLLGNGGGLAAFTGSTLTVDGVISSAIGAGPLIIGIPASAANGSTAGLLPGTGPGTANTTGGTTGYTNGSDYATGTVILAGANTYTGATNIEPGATLEVTGGLTATSSVAINGGTLDLNAANAIFASAHLTLATGTLAILASETENLGDLTLGAGASTLSLGATGSVIDFADSSLDAWSGTLSIADWNGNGTDLNGGGSDQVIFANDDLSGTQLGDITFVNPTIDGVAYTGSYSAAQLPSGEIVAAVPEPGTWGVMTAGAAMLVAWQRSRRRAS